ncbi:Cell division protein FtsQ [bioreactor metagenome]|uniref:Cell division protein FtsQ n=1 Tax=bioreactor metagenome TaxID=1076179 RepID=A0A645A4J8_9ZZZZ
MKRKDNLFTVNISQAAREILSAFPYVDQVSIHRRLPDTLVISVTECSPAACIQSGEDWWVLDAKGKLLEKGGGELEGLYIQVTGITPILPSAGSKLAVGDENSGKLSALTKLLAALESRGMTERVTAVDLTEDTVITLACDGRFTVKLPMNGDIDLKVRILKEATAALQSNETGLIDLTGEKGYFQPE